MYKRNVIPFLEKISKIKKIFERVIYINCIILGNIWAKNNNEDKGATFTFTLPIVTQISPIVK